MALAQRLDKLGAINLMLTSTGEQKVSTLVDDGVNDTDDAQQVLDEITIEVLSDGWDFNQIRTVLSPDTSGNISVTNNYLRIDGTDTDYRRRFTVRSNKLYDLDNATDVFDKAVTLKVTQNLEFDDIPSACAFFIARSAARVYQQQTRGDPQADQILAQQELRAWERLKKDNAKTQDFNWIHDSRSVTRLSAERGTRYQQDFENNRPI